MRALYQFFKIFLFALVILGGPLLAMYLHRESTLPIKQVQVIGSYDYLDKNLLEDLIMPYAKSNFFSVRLVELQQALLQLPWLASVQVRRIWPDTLLIVLTTRTPVARWGKVALLDESGNIFIPEKDRGLPEGLPEFEGAAASSLEILKQYEQMVALLATLNHSITSIQVNARDSWEITLDNGLVLYLGRDHLIERLTRFVHTYPQTIGAASSKIVPVSVDLRYDNGLAIQWKKNK